MSNEINYTNVKIEKLPPREKAYRYKKRTKFKGEVKTPKQQWKKTDSGRERVVGVILNRITF